MNKIYIFGMMALAVAGLSSCKADDDPVLHEPTEFVLNTPPFASQSYQLTEGNTIELTTSQPDYGITAAPTYVAEFSLLENFGEGMTAPDTEAGEPALSVMVSALNPQSTVLSFPDEEVCKAFLNMHGIYSMDDYDNKGGEELVAQPMYVRLHAAINDQPSTKIVSNTVKLDNVIPYNAYAVVKLDVLYTPGESNGWNQGASQMIPSYGKGLYKGFVYLTGTFKFTNQPDWNGVNYGNGGADGVLSTDGGAGNLEMPADGPGLYFADVNIETLTYTLQKVTSVGIAGNLNGWNAEAPIELTSENYLQWNYTGEFDGDGWKFVFNNGWTINLGGTYEDLVWDGDNLPSSAGEHTVTLDLSTYPYTCTFE